MNRRRWTYFIFWIHPNFHSQTRLHTSKANVWNKDIGDTNSDKEIALFLYKSAQEDFHIYYKEGSRIYENLLWFSFPWGACLWEGLNCTKFRNLLISGANFAYILHITHIIFYIYIIYMTYYILGTESKNQNGNLRWHLPWRGGRGVSRGSRLPLSYFEKWFF